MGAEGGMTVERLTEVIVMAVLMAFGALIVTGCVVGVYWLVGLVM